MSQRILLALVATTLLSTSLQAGDGKFGFGLNVGLASHGGELKDVADKGTSFVVGAHFKIHLAGGHVLMPRLDYGKVAGESYVEDNMPYGRLSLETDAKHLDFAVDYLFFPSGRPQGFYILGGLSQQKWTIDATMIETYGTWNGSSWEYTTDVFSGSESRSKLGPVIGLGYQWNSRFSAGLRHSKVNLEDDIAFQMTTIEFKYNF